MTMDSLKERLKWWLEQACGLIGNKADREDGYTASVELKHNKKYLKFKVQKLRDRKKDRTLSLFFFFWASFHDSP